MLNSVHQSGQPPSNTKTNKMEHILQRQQLRRPLTRVYYGPTWDVSDLDGGCDIWRRFQEKRLAPRRFPPRLEKAYRKEVEQFKKNLKNEAMTKSMWEQRAKDNADREGWMDTRAIGNSNTGTVEDDTDEDEDEDEDEYSTIYSCARRDPPASHKVSSCNLPSTSISSDDPHVTAPYTLKAMSLVYIPLIGGTMSKMPNGQECNQRTLSQSPHQHPHTMPHTTLPS
jgi:hypothetical protein